MRRHLLAALLCLPAVAAADTYLDKFKASAELVSLSGVKEVPLYRTSSGGGYSSVPLVLVEVGEGRKALFSLTWGDDEISISQGLADELKLKVKDTNRKLINIQGKDNRSKHGDERKHAQLPSLKLGELELGDATVAVKEKISGPKGYAVEGSLGLASLPDQLAWAVLPSQGVLRIGPAASGADLVSALGGETTDFRHTESYHEKIKVRSVKDEGFMPPLHHLIHGQVGASTGDISLAISADGECMVNATLVPADAPRRTKGDTTFAWLPVTLGGTSLGATWFKVLVWPETVTPFDAEAGLCNQLTSRLDIAVDPVNKKLAFKAIGDDARPQVDAVLLAEAQKPPPAEPPKEAEAPKEGEAAPAPEKKDVGPNKKQAAIQTTMGDANGAIANWTTVTEAEPRVCSGWQSLGQALLEADRPTDAIVALEKASSLYHAWWDLPREERLEIAKANKKLEPAELEAAEKIEQPSSCYTADGQLARARLAADQLEDVGALYRERLDLDPVLAIVAGNAALRLGENKAALEPYRQAILREPVDRPSDLARLGVALASRGNWTQAEPMFRRALEIDPYNAMTAALWGEAMVAALGPQAAQAAAADWARAYPDSASAHLNWVVLSNGADREAAITAAKAAFKVGYTAESQADRRALRARLHLIEGELDKAAEAAESATKANPSAPFPWVVAAQVAEARGEASNAALYRAKAARLGADNPAYAVR